MKNTPRTLGVKKRPLHLIWKENIFGKLFDKAKGSRASNNIQIFFKCLFLSSYVILRLDI
jgi:hypothetical protein